MQLQITLMKVVADEAEANALVTIVKTKLADHPEVTVSATVSEPVSGQ